MMITSGQLEAAAPPVAAGSGGRPRSPAGPPQIAWCRLRRDKVAMVASSSWSASTC